MADLDTDMTGDTPSADAAIAQADPSLDLIMDDPDYGNTHIILQNSFGDQQYETYDPQDASFTYEEELLQNTFVDGSGEATLGVGDDIISPELDDEDHHDLENTNLSPGKEVDRTIDDFRGQTTSQMAEELLNTDNAAQHIATRAYIETSSFGHEITDYETGNESSVFNKQHHTEHPKSLPGGENSERTSSIITSEVAIPIPGSATLEGINPTSVHGDITDLGASPEAASDSYRRTSLHSPTPVPEADEEQKYVQGGTEQDDALHTSGDRLLLDAITLIYHGEEMSLFPPSEGESSKMYLLSDVSLSDKPFQLLFESIRQVLAESIDDDTNLELAFPRLGIKIFEASDGISDFTLNQMLDLFVELQANEELNPLTHLRLYLCCHQGLHSVMNHLRQVVREGKGLSELLHPHSDGTADHKTPDFQGESDHGDFNGDKADVHESEDDEVWSKTGNPEEAEQFIKATEVAAIEQVKCVSESLTPVNDNAVIGTIQPDHSTEVTSSEILEKRLSSHIQNAKNQESSSVNATHRKSIIDDDDDELIDYSDDDDDIPETTSTQNLAKTATNERSVATLPSMNASLDDGEGPVGETDFFAPPSANFSLHDSAVDISEEATLENNKDKGALAASEHLVGPGFKVENRETTPAFANGDLEDRQNLDLAPYLDNNIQPLSHSSPKRIDWREPLLDEAESPGGSIRSDSNWIPEDPPESFGLEAENSYDHEGENDDSESTDRLIENPRTDQVLPGPGPEHENASDPEAGPDYLQSITEPDDDRKFHLDLDSDSIADDGLELPSENGLNPFTGQGFKAKTSDLPKKRAFDAESEDLDGLNADESGGSKRQKPS
ncbi:MAG: hypothetical protein M1814_004307 [Vezdaea aestivalis]|nr:MAG: hypothetical protein M1814_004307 [Vezdaea aestivalis]